MKQILYILVSTILFCSSYEAKSQSAPSDSVVYDSAGKPLWWKNQIIVKFNPALVNIAAVNNSSFVSGMLSDFMDSNIFVFLDTNGFYSSALGSLPTRKVYTRLSTFDTISISRTGDTVRMPSSWSTFLINWNSSTGFDYLPAIDTLNKFYPWIEFAQKNNIYTLLDIPNDSLMSAHKQAGLVTTSTYPNAHINMDSAWDISSGKDNTNVGVFDTGINWDHFDFNDSTNDSSYVNSRIKGGYDYTDNTNVYDKRDMDEYGHGTRMAGIIGAKRNNSIGMAGVAGGNNTSSNKGVSLYAIRIATKDYISITDQRLADAMHEGATSHNSSSGYGYGMHVMNFSFGGTATSEILQNEHRFCYVNAVAMVAGSGNDGDATVNYPASFKDDWIMKVGASDEVSAWASFSTYGTDLDFVAPGVGTLYSSLDNETNTKYYGSGNDGTSSATAHVSGVAALMISYINNNSFAPNPLWPEDIEHMLQKTAKRAVPSVPYDTKIGYGRINAGQTLSKMVLPRYKLTHYSQVVANNSNNVSQGTQIVNLHQNYQNLAAGLYYTTRYKISTNINITQPAGRTILDVWPRSAASNVWSALTSALLPENDVTIASHTSTNANLVGYIYHFTSAYPAGPIVDYWYPTDLNSNTNFALSVYSYDPTATDITSATINDDMVTIYPNPTNDVFTLTFGLLEKGDVKIDVLDMGGQVVKSILKKDFEQQHFETKIDLSGQSTGIYICRIQTINGVVSRKITLIR